MYKQESDLVKYYENLLKDLDNISYKITELREYTVSSLKFWKEFENPTFNVSEIYPKGEATTQKPYYRALTSFTNRDKKERLSCYIGPIAEFKYGKEDSDLRKIAVKKIREQMLEKSKLPPIDLNLDSKRDRYLESNYRIYQFINHFFRKPILRRDNPPKKPDDLFS
jgi:hypothetical protein